MKGKKHAALEAGELDVAGLYRDLVLTRALARRETLLLGSNSGSTDPALHFAEGAEALIGAVAHLKAAADFMGTRGSRELQLLALADEVVDEAVAFALTADIFAAGAEGTGSR